jgi:hypothetical protein
MRSRIESLWDSAAGEGALTPVGVARPESEFDALYEAWSRERHAAIECRLSLDEAGRLLRQILADDHVPSRIRRQARRWLQAFRAIHEAQHGQAPDEG